MEADAAPPFWGFPFGESGHDFLPPGESVGNFPSEGQKGVSI